MNAFYYINSYSNYIQDLEQFTDISSRFKEYFIDDIRFFVKVTIIDLKSPNYVDSRTIMVEIYFPFFINNVDSKTILKVYRESVLNFLMLDLSLDEDFSYYVVNQAIDNMSYGADFDRNIIHQLNRSLDDVMMEKDSLYEDDCFLDIEFSCKIFEVNPLIDSLKMSKIESKINKRKLRLI